MSNEAGGAISIMLSIIEPHGLLQPTALHGQFPSWTGRALRRVFKDYFCRHSDLRRHEKPVSMTTSALEAGFHAGIVRNADGNDL